MEKKIIRVLVADDTEIAREGLMRILERNEEIKVIGQVDDYHKVPERVQECNPDVVLMDLKWFGDETAGTETIRELKNTFPNIKVIAITAYENLIREARQVGADDALTKTFTKAGLINSIQFVMNRPAKQPEEQVEQARIPQDELSVREQDVIKLIAKGLRDKRIAEALMISENTVKNHVRSILSKLNAGNRTEAVGKARNRGYIP